MRSRVQKLWNSTLAGHTSAWALEPPIPPSRISLARQSKDLRENAVAPERKIFSVTELAQLFWCEKQFKLGYEHGGKVQTEEMRLGKNHHRLLEEQEHGSVAMDHVESPVDKFALRIIQTIDRLYHLQRGGQNAREVYVFAEVEGFWISGIIDCLRVENFEPDLLYIVDDKTRGRPTLPSEDQLEVSRFQIELYRTLVHYMQTATWIYWKEYLEFRALDPHIKFSPAVQGRCHALGLPETLAELVPVYLKAYRGLPCVSKKLTVRYTHQKSHNWIGDEVWWYKSAKFQAKCREKWTLLRGERDALAASNWHCGHCQFYHSSKCTASTWTRAKKIKQN